MRLSVKIIAGALSLLTAAGAALAQQAFPTRPITVLVPAPPGGGTDMLSRTLAELAEPILGQKVIVENKPGASGTLGITLLTQAAPDGYTLGGAFNGPLTALPHTQSVPYDLDSYIPILEFGSSGYVFCVRSDFPAKEGKAFIEHLKANPGKYTYAVDGIGNTVHLGAEVLFQRFGIKARAVPFNGASEQLRAVLGTHVDIFTGSSGIVLSHVKAGTLHCPMVTTLSKNPAVPTGTSLKELGVNDFEAALWWGLIAPKGTPPERIKILEEAFRKAKDSPKFKETLAKLGATDERPGQQEFMKHIRDEYEVNAKVVKQLGLTSKK